MKHWRKFKMTKLLLFLLIGFNSLWSHTQRNVEGGTGYRRDDPSMEYWTRNYNALVEILKQNKDVGNCTLRLLQDPHSPEGSWMLNIWRNSIEIMNFGIVPPISTGGRTQVDKMAEDTYIYRASDVVGWTNLIVQRETFKNTVTKIRINKTLPNGTVYDQGIKCEK